MSPVDTVQTVSGTPSAAMTDNEQRVWDYLVANPDAIALSVRKLGDAVGVSKTTAAAILAKFKQAKGM